MSVFLNSCDDDNERKLIFPYLPNTNISIDLNDPKFFDLNSAGQAIVINDYLGRKVGYKDNGIIVIKVYDGDDGYKAWDATSTADRESKLQIDGSVGICPKSGIKYNLMNGSPLEEKDKSSSVKVHSLQRYRCYVNASGKIKIENPDR